MILQLQCILNHTTLRGQFDSIVYLEAIQYLHNLLA